MDRLFHGTASYELESFIKEGALIRFRKSGYKPAFCTSVSFNEAAFFALRKTPISDLSKTGIVLEFDATRLRPDEYEFYKSPGVLRDEHEVRVYEPSILRLRGYYEYDNGTWVRQEV